MRNPVRRRRGTGPRPEDAPRPGCRSCRLVPMQRTPRPAPPPPPPFPAPPRPAPEPPGGDSASGGAPGAEPGGRWRRGRGAGRGEAPGAAVRGLRKAAFPLPGQKGPLPSVLQRSGAAAPFSPQGAAPRGGGEAQAGSEALSPRSRPVKMAALLITPTSPPPSDACSPPRSSRRGWRPALRQHGGRSLSAPTWRRGACARPRRALPLPERSGTGRDGTGRRGPAGGPAASRFPVF